MQRREFLKAATGAMAVAGLARAAGVDIRLGMDSYSIRAFDLRAHALLDYAASQKLDTIQLSGLEDYVNLDPKYLATVKDRAAELGISLDAGMGCVCPISKSWVDKGKTASEAAAEGLRVAHAVGATAMRCFMGSLTDRRQNERPIEAYMEETIKVFRSVRSLATDLNVKIALENHAGDMQAREVRTIIEQAGREYVAACLDTGNPMWVMENPVVTMEVLGPYTVTTHVRDSVVFEHPRGAAAQWVALGDGVTDLPKIIELHKQLCPKAAMQLEIITGRPPQVLPYLEPEFWKYFEKTPASEFARFLELARRGHPFMGAMVIEDVSEGRKVPEYMAALKEQQKVDLERSFEFARKQLSVGVKWRH